MLHPEHIKKCFHRFSVVEASPTRSASAEGFELLIIQHFQGFSLSEGVVGLVGDGKTFFYFHLLPVSVLISAMIKIIKCIKALAEQ